MCARVYGWLDLFLCLYGYAHRRDLLSFHDPPSSELYTITVNGTAYHVDVAPAAAGAAPHVTSVQPAAAPAPAAPAAAPAAAGPGTEIASPMPGTVLRILVEAGDAVASGATILVIEAMKMEQEIKTPAAGKVRSLDVTVGETVETGQVVAVVG